MILSVTDLHKVILKEEEPPACDRTLGITLIEAKDGKAIGSWKIEEHLLNANGIVINGFITAAADIMMSYAITTLINENQTNASFNLATTFHTPLHAGLVEIEAKVEQFGSMISYLSAMMTQDNVKTVEVISTMVIINKPSNASDN
jgi:acyl-CoA thioesterase